MNSLAENKDLAIFEVQFPTHNQQQNKGYIMDYQGEYYKMMKELNVEGFTGTSRSHVFMVTFCITVSISFYDQTCYLNLHLVIPYLRLKFKWFDKIRENKDEDSYILLLNTVIEHFIVLHPFIHVLVASNTHGFSVLSS